MESTLLPVNSAPITAAPNCQAAVHADSDSRSSVAKVRRVRTTAWPSAPQACQAACGLSQG